MYGDNIRDGKRYVVCDMCAWRIRACNTLISAGDGIGAEEIGMLTSAAMDGMHSRRDISSNRRVCRSCGCNQGGVMQQ